MPNGSTAGGIRVSWTALGPILAAIAMIVGLFSWIRSQDMRSMESRMSATERAVEIEKNERKEEISKVYRLLERMDEKLDKIQEDVRQ